MAAAAVQCHHLPLFHSLTLSSPLAWVFSAPLQSHFEVLTRKKTTCYFFFVETVSAEELSEAGQDTVREALEVLQERGRAVGQRAGKHRWLWWPASSWLRLPRSCTLPLQAGADVVTAAIETVWLTIQPHKHWCCPT